MASFPHSQDEPFIYTPLDRSTRSIRLLQFTDPPPGSEPRLHFTLTVHELPTKAKQTRDNSQQTKFMALSYVWGDKEPQFPIVVNGNRLNIRENLHALLRVLYIKTQAANRQEQTDRPRPPLPDLPEYLSKYIRKYPYLWADAICIDQESVEERNHQVNMMGAIYLGANCVVSWLGPSSDDSSLAMDFLQTEFKWADTLKPPQRVANALLALLNRPYWHRLWIVQEFVLARTSVLLCGQSIFSTDRTLLDLKYQALVRWSAASNTAAWVVLYARSEFFTNYSGIPCLHCLVGTFKDQKCKNRKDRIFALLALYNQSRPKEEVDKPRISANYKVPLERLFYMALGECGLECTGKDLLYSFGETVERTMKEALGVPHYVIRTGDTRAFVDEVLGREYLSSVPLPSNRGYEMCCFCREWPDCKINQKRILEKRSIEDVTGHIATLTGLSREEMHKDPEGTYLEVLGRLDPFYCHEGFTYVLRRALGIPLVDNDAL